MKKTNVLWMLWCIFLLSCSAGKKIKAANEQIQNLNGQVATLNKQVDDLNKKVADDANAINQLKQTNVQSIKEATDCKEQKAIVEKKFTVLSNAVAERINAMKLIKEKAAKALEIFKQYGAEVIYRNGFVQITIPDKLAFPSGSTKISDDGRQVLSVVADVLEDNPTVTAIILGNTDSIPIKKTFKDNWSLSTERANEMVRSLITTYKVDATRITAAGKGKYNPISDNSTPEGRAQNRRIDIFLNPNLDGLWTLSEGK